MTDDLKPYPDYRNIDLTWLESVPGVAPLNVENERQALLALSR